ncbi:MAG TPA: hypothetical protein VKU00_14100 [Chthonomonadaceae bacterium]|nr:hypothetical protein [Chthonomonadaceae bacterium]
MRKSSWILLGVSVVLLILLGYAYLQSQNASENLTEAQVAEMLKKMQDAVTHRNANGIMDMISPDPGARIADMHPDQLRVMLARAFRQSGPFRTDISGVALQSSPNEANVQFDLEVQHVMDGGIGKDYSGHVTLEMQRMDVPVLLGIFHTKQWRIVHAETPGADPSMYGDY